LNMLSISAIAMPLLLLENQPGVILVSRMQFQYMRTIIYWDYSVLVRRWIMQEYWLSYSNGATSGFPKVKSRNPKSVVLNAFNSSILDPFPGIDG
jgi:hypothetical protein